MAVAYTNTDDVSGEQTAGLFASGMVKSYEEHPASEPFR